MSFNSDNSASITRLTEYCTLKYLLLLLHYLQVLRCENCPRCGSKVFSNFIDPCHCLYLSSVRKASVKKSMARTRVWLQVITLRPGPAGDERLVWSGTQSSNMSLQGNDSCHGTRAEHAATMIAGSPICSHWAHCRDDDCWGPDMQSLSALQGRWLLGGPDMQSLSALQGRWLLGAPICSH